MVAKAGHCVAIAEFVSQCAPTLQLTENRFRCGSAHFKLRTHFLQSGPECFDLFLLLCYRSLEVRHFVLFLDERCVAYRFELPVLTTRDQVEIGSRRPPRPPSSSRGSGLHQFLSYNSK
jgi:hypothetical protein